MNKFILNRVDEKQFISFLLWLFEKHPEIFTEKLMTEYNEFKKNGGAK